MTASLPERRTAPPLPLAGEEGAQASPGDAWEGEGRRRRPRPRPKWKSKNTAVARQLRRQLTDPERRLWYALRARQISGAKFKRQYPIGPYIVDFVCLERKLVVEADGEQHALPDRLAHDERRTRWLRDRGFVVLRFANRDILTNLAGVLEAIAAGLAEPSPPIRRGRMGPSSPASGRG